MTDNSENILNYQLRSNLKLNLVLESSQVCNSVQPAEPSNPGNTENPDSQKHSVTRCVISLLTLASVY